MRSVWWQRSLLVLGLVLALSGLVPLAGLAQQPDGGGPDDPRTPTIVNTVVTSAGATDPGMLGIQATVSALSEAGVVPTGMVTFAGNGVSYEVEVARVNASSLSAQAAIPWPATGGDLTITYGGDATHAPSSTIVRIGPSWLPPLWFMGATGAILTLPQDHEAQSAPSGGAGPIIIALSQVQGSIEGGLTLIIQGENLGGTTSVTFDGLAAQAFTVIDPATISVITPAHPIGPAEVRVVTATGSAIAPTQFSYVGPRAVPAPIVTSVSPNSGPTSGGTSVTISGRNFTGANRVTFGGGTASNVVVIDDTTITATTPSFGGPNTVDVAVSLASGETGTGQQLFTYLGPPNVNGVSPQSGPTAGGTAITISGQNLTGATQVVFGGIPLTSFTVVNSNTITAVTPTHAAGAVDVRVTTPVGSATASNVFTYVAPRPVVTLVTPNAGPTSGGTSVTITGQFFTGATSVTFGGSLASNIVVVNDSTITATTPAFGGANTVDVSVTTPSGTGTGARLFTYVTGPAVTVVSPNSGPTTGLTVVTITGFNFTGATTVLFGGNTAASFVVNSATSITATTPQHTSGTVNITVTTPDGTGTGVALFTYVSVVPTVTAVSPGSGPTSGGTTVTITGTNFSGVTAVTFGGIPATNFAVNSPTSITAVTPPHAAGAVDVEVSTGGGTGTGASLFTYLVPAPTVTAVSPGSGLTSGGTSVTITGTNLAGATAVTFGGTTATSFTINSATSITAVTPAHVAGIVDVQVATPGGTATGASLFTYVVPIPTITSVSPGSGPTSGGTAVTITGTNLTGATAVTFGGQAATSFTVNNATSITAVTPPGAAGTVDVQVTTGGGTATGISLFIYVVPAPTVTAIAPVSGPTSGGTTVTITGTNFTGASAVRLGGTAVTSFTVDSATSITAVTPAHAAGAVDVEVTTAGGTATGVALFTYVVPAPTVTAVSPTEGPTTGGTAVTITGTNLTGATAVSFGGTPVTSFTVVSDTSISAVTPAHAAGAVDVAVTTPGGTATGASFFTFVPGEPGVTSVAPDVGPTAGGTTVTITGINLTGATAVLFGGTPAASFTVNSDTSITAVTPAHPAGPVDVTVTALARTGIGSALFTFVAGAPTVTSVSPGSGPTSGGTTVTITGTNFTNPSAVTFGGVPVLSVVVDSDTSITVLTPAHAAGPVDVAVTTAGGTGAGVGLFTYLVPAPTVTAVFPTSGPTSGGTNVTITGTNLTGATAVTFGGTAATSFTVDSDTSITAVAPAHAAGTVDVAVTTPGGTGTGSSLFTYVLLPPVVTSVSPNSGSTTGGTTVTITGEHLIGVTSVTFGGVEATSFTVDSDTSITAVTPAHTPGLVGIQVTSPAGLGARPSLFVFTVEAPTVSAVSPSSGPTSGGTTVTITGTNFTGATAVVVGGATVTSFTVNSPTSITAVTPPHAAGTADVEVTTPAGTATGAALYTYIASPPTVRSVRPGGGPVIGGTTVTIFGTNFTSATTVLFGGVAATSFTVNSPVSITATAPAHAAGKVDVQVTNPAGTGTGIELYTYAIAAPTVTSVTPSSGRIQGGTIVTITGTRFTGATAVTFGGVAVSRFTVTSPTSIIAVAPPHAAGAVDVDVTTPVGTGTGASLYTYRIGLPTVTAVAPGSGPTSGGTSVTITGTNFTGASAVTFGGVAATRFTVNSPTSITAVTPARAAGVVDVQVTTPTGTGTGAALYTFSIAPPTVTAVSPRSGPTAGGTTVTITGTNFTGATAVSFGGMAITSFTVTSPTSITATTPAHPGGIVDVQVTTSAGTGTGASLYSFVVPAPTVSRVTPARGPAIGGTAVAIIGTNFLGTTSVRFGGVAVTDFVVASATVITVLTPPHPAGAVDVEVTTPGGTASLKGGFTYEVPADSARLRRTQILLTKMVANTSGAAISGGVNRAVSDGFIDVCDPIAVSGDTVRVNLVPCAQDGLQNPWRFWAETRGTGWSSTPLAGDITGDQINALLGATYRPFDDLLIGGLVGYETFDYRTAIEDGQLQGDGWTVGGYFGWRPLPGVLVDGSLSRSEIGYDVTAGLASGAFDGHRWLGTIDVSGTVEAGAWLLEPSASAYAIWESEDGYTDTLGTQQAQRDFATGRVSAGLNGTYSFWWDNTIAIAPHLGLFGDFYFANDDAQLAGDDADLSGWSARLTTGLSAQMGSQTFSLDAEYGGLGSEYSNWAVSARYSVQF